MAKKTLSLSKPNEYPAGRESRKLQEESKIRVNHVLRWLELARTLRLKLDETEATYELMSGNLSQPLPS